MSKLNLELTRINNLNEALQREDRTKSQNNYLFAVAAVAFVLMFVSFVLPAVAMVAAASTMAGITMVTVATAGLRNINAKNESIKAAGELFKDASSCRNNFDLLNDLAIEVRKLHQKEKNLPVLDVVLKVVQNHKDDFAGISVVSIADSSGAFKDVRLAEYSPPKFNERGERVIEGAHSFVRSGSVDSFASTETAVSSVDSPRGELDLSRPSSREDLSSIRGKRPGGVVPLVPEADVEALQNEADKISRLVDGVQQAGTISSPAARSDAIREGGKEIK